MSDNANPVRDIGSTLLQHRDYEAMKAERDALQARVRELEVERAEVKTWIQQWVDDNFIFLDDELAAYLAEEPRP